jgi:hypothetical protein
MTTKTYWLIETSGDKRQIWGPYTRKHAEAEAGNRHAVATGEGMSDGQIMDRNALQTAINSGRIRLCDTNINATSFAAS